MGSSNSKNVDFEAEIISRYGEERHRCRTENQKKLFNGNEINQWFDHFKKASDKKIDGVPGLSKNKFTTLYQRFYPKSNVELFAQLMFDHLDADQSGTIDFVEFYQVIIVTELSLESKVADMVFSGADKNSNGYLEKQEVADLMVAVYEMGGFDTRKPENQPDVEAFFTKLQTEAILETPDQVTLTEWRQLIAKDNILKASFMKFGFKA